MGKEKLQQALTWTRGILNSSSLLVERQSSPATTEIDIEVAQKAWDRSVTRSSCTPLSYITKGLYPLYRDFCSPIYTAAYSHQWGNRSSLDVHHMVNGSWESGLFIQQNIVWKSSVLTFPGSEGTETPKRQTAQVVSYIGPSFHSLDDDVCIGVPIEARKVERTHGARVSSDGW